MAVEFKHFSHDHGLVFHQTSESPQIHCSGCKTPGSGPVYVCWKCNFFLHEQCFRATRTLRHSSHPLHPLTLVPYPTHQSATFFCDSCKLAGYGFSYCCSECDFDLHVHCAHAGGVSIPHGTHMTSVVITSASNVSSDVSAHHHHHVQGSVYPPPPPPVQSSPFPSYMP